MNEPSQKALTRALYKVLRPMVRLLMRHGMTYRLFADVARNVFVDVAEEDFALPGRKPSKSRTAVLTGINRKDIAKLKERPHPLSDGAAEAPAPAARLISGWINDDSFHTNGNPLELPIEAQEDGSVSFSELARRYTTDVPVRALLDELRRIRAIEVESDKVRLLVNAYIPQRDVRENLRIFATAAADLMTTIDHNIAGNSPDRLIQRTVSYDNIPIEVLETIRERSRSEGEAFLLQVNDWLAKSENTAPVEQKERRARAGIGLYYFEHLADDVQQERLK